MTPDMFDGIFNSVRTFFFVALVAAFVVGAVVALAVVWWLQ